MPEYDLIIVGCGTTGSTAASIAAKAGLKTVVLDRKPKEKIGRKTCGDAIHIDHVNYVEQRGVHLSKEALGQHIDSMAIISPDKKKRLDIEDEGYCTNRYLMGQELMEQVEQNGARLVTEVKSIAPIVEDGAVVGIQTSDEELRASVTIDASGIGGVVRKQLQFETDFPKNFTAEYYASGYRGVVELEKPFETPSTIIIEFNQEVAPAGYIWYFPLTNNRLNLGLGLKGPENALKNYHDFVKSQYAIKNVENESAWAIPMHRPISSFVANGFMLVGDSGCQVNPLDGAGIGYGMKAAGSAVDTIVKAKEREDFSKESLWNYNVEYLQKNGAKFAQLSVLTAAMETLSNEDMNFIFHKEIITETDIIKAYTGAGLELSAADKIKKALKGRKRLDLLKLLDHVAKGMRSVKDVYKKYPEKPEGYAAWVDEANTAYDDAVNQFVKAK